MASEEDRQKGVLQTLRIRAKPIVIRWDSGEEARQGGERADQANRLLRKQSEETAVVFVYLPAPHASLVHPGYLRELRLLTSGLCPTLLVHAIRSVVTTNL